MAINAYDACPCGSGKKFKWCCAPYYDRVILANKQQEDGQHEAALQTLKNLTIEFADKPQVWCYYANFLAAAGMVEQAEESLQQAISVQPDFAMPHLLRGYIRLAEGERIGALLLFRKAAELYPLDATQQLANAYELIAREEMTLNRPVAVRAALERALLMNPADGELRQQFDQLFGEHSALPRVASKKYAFRPTGKPLPPGADTGRLSDARKAIEAVAAQFPDDPAAQFNLGLIRAWMGDNGPAIEALGRSLELEADDFRAEETGALMELLKVGEGAFGDGDFVEHRSFMPIRDAEAVFRLLQQLEAEQRLIGARLIEEHGIFSALIVEHLPALLETGTKLARPLANFMVGGGAMRIWSTSSENVQNIVQDFRDRLMLAVGEPQTHESHANLQDIGNDMIAYPIQVTDPDDATRKLKEYAERFLLDELPARPFKALNGTAPLDAVGSTLLRKKLLGLLRFLEDCVDANVPKFQNKADGEVIALFDFSKLRHKLGLDMRAADAQVPQHEQASRDFSGMSAADLGQLRPAELSTAELEQAMRAAIKLQAHELAVAFANEGAARPIDAEKPDRYPFFACIMTGAVVLGQPDAAIKALADGRAWDAAHNSGQRANEYGLRSAALYAKLGRVDESVEEFDAVIDRNPNEGNLYVKAAETMLSIKNGAKARYFAEKGIARAKTTGQRDLQEACEDLLAAAKKMM